MGMNVDTPHAALLVLIDQRCLGTEIVSITQGQTAFSPPAAHRLNAR